MKYRPFTRPLVIFCTKQVELEKLDQFGVPPDIEKVLFIVTSGDVKPKVTVPRTHPTGEFIADRIEPRSGLSGFHYEVS